MTVLTITGITHDLRGVARLDGQVWFVEGALPDEQVQAREIHCRQQMVEAELIAVDSASSLRIEPACEYYGQCGGCTLQHLDHQGQVALKQQVLLEQLKRMAGIEPVEVLPPVVASAWHYRRRARLAIRWLSDNKHLALGFRHGKSRKIVEITHCAVLLPELASIITPFRDCLSRWRNHARLGHVDMVYVQGTVHIGLRMIEPPSPHEIDSLLLFARENGVAVFLETGQDNTVTYLEGTAPPAPGFYPRDFLQSNESINDAMVDAAINMLEGQSADAVLEAYCGLGNFTFPLASKVGQVTALEIDQGMVDRSILAARERTITNVDFKAEDLESAKNLSGISGFSKILLDPPRQGARHFCEQVTLKGVERLVYVSCNPSTLARDAAILCGRGLSLASIRFVDMFPQTIHIESIAVFVPQPRIQKTEAAEKKPAKGRRIKPFSIR